MFHGYGMALRLGVLCFIQLAFARGANVSTGCLILSRPISGLVQEGHICGLVQAGISVVSSHLVPCRHNSHLTSYRLILAYHSSRLILSCHTISPRLASSRLSKSLASSPTSHLGSHLPSQQLFCLPCRLILSCHITRLVSSRLVSFRLVLSCHISRLVSASANLSSHLPPLISHLPPIILSPVSSCFLSSRHVSSRLVSSRRVASLFFSSPLLFLHFFHLFGRAGSFGRPGVSCCG